MKEIYSPGSYGLNPSKVQLDMPIHCWSFSCVPSMTETEKQCMTETDKQYKMDTTKVCWRKVLEKRMTGRRPSPSRPTMKATRERPRNEEPSSCPSLTTASKNPVPRPAPRTNSLALQTDLKEPS